MNYFEIIKKVAVCPGINLKEPQVFDTSDSQIKKIKNAVNQALKSVCSCWDWNFRVKKTVFESVSGLSEYNGVGGNIFKVLCERDISTQYELTYSSDIDIMSRSGIPCSYKIRFGKIALYPTPSESKTVTVYYYTDKYAYTDEQVEKEELEYETDVPLIPEKYQDLIVHKAVLNYFAKPSKKEYPYYLAQYCERLSQVKLDDRDSLGNTLSIEISGRSQLLKRFGR